MPTGPIQNYNIDVRRTASFADNNYAVNPIKSADSQAYNYTKAVGDSVSFSGTKEAAAINAAPTKKETTAALRESLNETKGKQGWIGKAWDGIKNGFFFGLKFGAGSDKAAAAIEKFEKGEISEEEATQAVEKYKAGQEQCVEIFADVASGIASAAMYAVALGGAVAAPFTGGASLGITLAAIGSASAVGATAKVGIKALDAASGGREYSLKDAGKDALTGAINGPLAFATAGIGCGLSQVGAKMGINCAKAAAQTAGSQVVVGFGKAVSKEAVEEAAKAAGREVTKNTVKQIGKEYFGSMSKSAIKNASSELTKTVVMSKAEMIAKETGKEFGKRLAFNTAQGGLQGSAMGSVGASSRYLIDCAVGDKVFSGTELYNTFSAGLKGGFVLGATMSATGTVVGKGYNLTNNKVKIHNIEKSIKDIKADYADKTSGFSKQINSEIDSTLSEISKMKYHGDAKALAQELSGKITYFEKLDSALMDFKALSKTGAQMPLTNEAKLEVISKITKNPEEQKLILRMLDSETIVVTKEAEEIVMRAQFASFLQANSGVKKEDIYIFSPRPDGKDVIKSYQTSGKAFAKANDISPSRIIETFDNIPKDKNVVVFMPDDCSISGASMVIDSLKDLPKDFKGTIVFSPTVMGSGNTLNGKVMADGVLPLLESLNSPRTNRQEVVDKLIKLISDNKSQNKEILGGLVDNYTDTRFVKTDKSLMATNFRETATFQSLSKEEQRIVDGLITSNGINNGYNRSATLVMMDMTRKTPNNNAGIIEFFGNEMGYKTKPSGILTYTQNVELSNNNLTPSLGAGPVIKNGNITHLDYEYFLPDGKVKTFKIPVGKINPSNVEIAVTLADGTEKTIMYTPQLEAIKSVTESVVENRSYGFDVNGASSNFRALKSFGYPHFLPTKGSESAFYVDVLAIPKDASIKSIGGIPIGELIK